jgi:glycosyltransferase involved in cell wall biosynthesis
MNKPLISVVVPVYNVEEFLDDCVQSIVNQTYKNLEIILVDDGSSDHCPEICDKWLKTDSRIQVIRKNNGGLSSARNVGVERATGEYIGFIDSDDYIHPQMYECLLSALRKSSLKIASCTFKRVLNSDETEILSGICKAEELNLKESLDSVFYGDMSVSVCCKLFAKEVFTSVRFPVGETNEDACVTIPTLALSEGTVYIREKMYCYRDRATSITHSYWKTDADIVYLHLQQMQKQLDSIGYGNLPSFKVYLVDSAYSVALCLDKNYSRITETAKENQLKYLAIMRRYWLRTIFSRHVVVKDKLLYSLIVTRTLRPVYTVLGKELN